MHFSFTLLGLKTLFLSFGLIELQRKDLALILFQYLTVPLIYVTLLSTQMAGNISTFCSPFLTLWIKLVVFQVVLLLHGTGYAANTVANYTANPSELPVLPENLPAPADMPILINNRFVDADKTYEIWPKEKKMPRFLWVAVKDEKEDLPPHITALMKRNDGWMPQVCDNDCKQAFLNKYWAGTSVLWAYNNISWGSSKANIWRYAVLYTYGGMYIDDDSDFTTNFDDIIRPEDSLLLSQEGVPDFKPCYESYYHLSDSAFYKRYEKLLNNPDYDKEHVYFQGLQALDFEITPDITTDERNAANALSSYLIVPVQKNKVQTPVFFHGSTLLNWGTYCFTVIWIFFVDLDFVEINIPLHHCCIIQC